MCVIVSVNVWRCTNCQYAFESQFIALVCFKAGHERRLGLPARCDKLWFCSTFCGSAGMERDGMSSIWDLVRSFNMYDPMALMVSSPQLRLRFFSGNKKVGDRDADDCVLSYLE